MRLTGTLKVLRRTLNPPPRRDPTGEDDDATSWMVDDRVQHQPVQQVGVFVELGCATDRAVCAANRLCRNMQVRPPLPLLMSNGNEKVPTQDSP
jgi:hypothetical protein